MGVAISERFARVTRAAGIIATTVAGSAVGVRLVLLGPRALPGLVHVFGLLLFVEREECVGAQGTRLFVVRSLPSVQVVEHSVDCHQLTVGSVDGGVVGILFRYDVHAEE